MNKYALILIFLPFSLFAQNNGDSLKFEIIKSSLSFLATDIETFKESSGKAANCNNGDYACLIEYSKKNKLEGSDRKVTAWRKEKTASQAEIEALGDKIVAELTSGNSRGRRKELPAFAEYQKQLSLLAASFTETPEPQTQAAENENISPPPQPPATNQTPTIQDEAKTESKLPIISLISSLLALAIGGLVFARDSKSSQASKKYNADYLILKEDIKELKTRIAQKQPVDLKPLQDKLNNIETRVEKLEHLPRITENEGYSLDRNKNLKIEQRNFNSSNSSGQNNAFAKLPDLGNGFSNSILAKEQNGEQIYEIEIKGDNGSFTITEDANAQKYALSDFNYYLSSACDFYNQPVKGAHIKVLEKGTLAKSGDNWIIQSKSKIEFR